jgi:hypothetical protein
MSKKSKIDDLCELVVDERVLSVLINKLTVIFTPLIQSTVKQMAADITKEVTAALTLNMEQICQDRFSKTEEQLSDVHKELASLKTNNTILTGRIEELERHSKLANLVIHGIPSSPPATMDTDSAQSAQFALHETDRSLMTAVIQLFQVGLKINVSEQDISTVHRLPGKKKDQHGPTIVSFVTRRIRNEIFRARKLLRTNYQPSGANSSQKQFIFINEHLTKPTAQIFASARKMVREKVITSCWTNGGIVYARKSAEASESPKRILTLDDLENLIL